MGTGAAEEAARVFGDAAFLSVQKQLIPHGLALKSLQSSIENQNVNSSKNFVSEDLSPRHMKQLHSNSQRDISVTYHGLPQAGGTGSQNGGTTTVSFYNTPSPMATTTQV